jgi:Lrp/AsnC family leucine-responsive transcriptional regulator
MKELIYKLDTKDKKILYHLNSNARQPLSQISKKVGLSQEVVNYRIKKLEDNNIITNYQLIVNLSKLGIFQFKICLSLQHITSKVLTQIISKLKLKEEIKWIASSSGNWDIIISAEASSISQIDKIKNETIEAFENYINEKSVAILVQGSTYNRDYLLETPEKSKERIIMKESNPIKLDKIELEILKELSKNARTSVIEIATKLKTTARIISYNIQQLQKKEIILGFKIAINYELLGIKFYKTFIYLDKPESKKVEALNTFLENHKNVIHNGKVLGNWDLEPEFETYSEQEFDSILTKIKDNFPDIIKKIDIITIQQEHKFLYF